MSPTLSSADIACWVCEAAGLASAHAANASGSSRDSFIDPPVADTITQLVYHSRICDRFSRVQQQKAQYLQALTSRHTSGSVSRMRQWIPTLVLGLLTCCAACTESRTTITSPSTTT